MDIVYLHGLKLECTIGVWSWEKQIRQVLTLDLDMQADVPAAAENDDLHQALDYQAISDRILTHAAEQRFELIESLAESIANVVLSEFPTRWLRIKLDKGAAVKAAKHVGVIIERGDTSA